MFNVEQNLSKKNDATLKQSNLKEVTNLTNFYVQKAKCPRRLGDIVQDFAHVFYMPIPRPDFRGKGVFLLFFRRNNCPRRATISKNLD